MSRNVEIKARVRDPIAVESRVAELADGPPVDLEQHDTFFPVPNGRLKLRRFPDGSGELIHYDRPDETGPKLSDYVIHRTREGDTLLPPLTRALGVRGVVRKERRLYTVGRTRVHLDTVEGLGSYLELEVVLDRGQSREDGERTAHDLLARLGVHPEDLVEGAYIDLLHSRDTKTD
jgi:adenylate cyclase